ncbi:thiamine-phosphate kinase [Dichotomicrobium thermohalophilum]|uniref:Thiamine-monophosphate kinase n=1 Tax=Dichotomicrobium thermohalophilum TaxID=933063 RepID=A0A397Q2B4_9HYPH|nr:thiamine-phosphate kinase [Dichotomicrobium thermohalophilum]RIA55198.1 thiamine-phosphate kinase [Dichotomicrobium thermohalophilum]
MDEEDIIRTYFAPLAAGLPGAFDLKDDAAALAPPPDTDLVVTTDALVAGVHFLPDDPPADVAAKALGVNLSDLAGKGADPLAYTLSVSLPTPPSANWLAGFRDGLAALQEAHGIQLIGGDTTCSPTAVMLSIAAFGTVPAGRMVRRSTARVGDLLYASGTIGDAALGLYVATKDKRTDKWGLDLEAQNDLLSRYRRPQPRTNLARVVRDFATAGLDISDGLVIDAARLCRTSGVSTTMRVENVPLSRAARDCLHADPDCLETILTGGDDYELLFTVPPQRVDALCGAAEAAGTPVHCVGEITGPATQQEASPVTVIGNDGAPLHLAHSGYTHFA